MNKLFAVNLQVLLEAEGESEASDYVSETMRGLFLDWQYLAPTYHPPKEITQSEAERIFEQYEIEINEAVEMSYKTNYVRRIIERKRKGEEVTSADVQYIKEFLRQDLTPIGDQPLIAEIYRFFPKEYGEYLVEDATKDDLERDFQELVSKDLHEYEKREGWLLSYAIRPEGRWYEIQRNDSSYLLADDKEAVHLVLSQANLGSKLHKAVIEFIIKHSPIEYAFWVNNDMLTQKEIKMLNEEKQEARELLIDSVVNCLKDDFSWQEYNPLREFILSKLSNRDLLEYMKSRARGTKS